MSSKRTTMRVFALSCVFAAIASIPALPQQTQPPNRSQPSLVPVAETKLLMEGLAHANFRGLESLLKKQPANVQSWKFARGQALLIAETGNLLMLRPPKGAGQAAWFEHAMKLRESAKALAVASGRRDYVTSRTLLVQVANRCNSCHNDFRIAKEIVPFAAK